MKNSKCSYERRILHALHVVYIVRVHSHYATAISVTVGWVHVITILITSMSKMEVAFSILYSWEHGLLYTL